MYDSKCWPSLPQQAAALAEALSRLHTTVTAGPMAKIARSEGGREATYQGYQTLHPIRAAVAAAFSNSRTLKWALKI